MIPAALFDPVAIEAMRLRNRTVMAPMTRRQSPGGIPTSDVAGYYRRRAEGGVGMVVTEGLAIDHAVAIQDSIIPNIHDPEAIERWAAIARAVQAAGAAFVPQLWHIGAARFKYATVPNAHLPTVSASGIYHTGKVQGDAADQAEIDAVVASYGRAARVAMAATRSTFMAATAI